MFYKISSTKNGIKLKLSCFQTFLVAASSNFNQNDNNFNNQHPIGNHKFLDNRINQNNNMNTNNNNNNNHYCNDLIHDMNSHLNFNNKSKSNGHAFHPVPQQQPQQQQPEPQPVLNRTKSSKLLDSLSSVATTIFKPKIQKLQEVCNPSNHNNNNNNNHAHSQLFNETGAQKNVRLLNQADHGNTNSQFTGSNNSMDISSVPSPSLANGPNSHHSAFHNYNNQTNSNYTGKYARRF